VLVRAVANELPPCFVQGCTLNTAEFALPYLVERMSTRSLAMSRSPSFSGISESGGKRVALGKG
jgi:hypothetical protein